MRRIRKPLVLCVAILLGCAAQFNPDLSDSDGSGATSDASTAGTGSETGTSDSTTGEAGTGSTDEAGSTGDGDGDGDVGTETGDGDGDAVCGDGVLDPGEDCDLSAGEGQDGISGPGGWSCEDLGFFETPTLGCWEDCTFDISNCTLGGLQPTDGLMWAHCDTQTPCQEDEGFYCIGESANGFCTKSCDHTSECGAMPGGASPPLCVWNTCLLSCEGIGMGESACPSGVGGDDMICTFYSAYGQKVCL